MATPWNHRAVWNHAYEYRRDSATGPDLEQAVTGRTIGRRDGVRRSTVIINLNKIVTITRWSTRAQLADQDRARLFCYQDRASGRSEERRVGKECRSRW